MMWPVLEIRKPKQSNLNFIPIVQKNLRMKFNELKKKPNYNACIEFIVQKIIITEDGAETEEI